MGEETQSNSVAVVTGGASGIGLACARRLGWQRELVLVDFKPVPGSKIAELSAQFDLVIGRTPADTNEGRRR